VPDPYSGVDLDAARAACVRDFRTCNRILAQDPTIPQLLRVSNCERDWIAFWRCNHPDAAERQRLAALLAEKDRLAEEIFLRALRQLERIEAYANAN
jgi:hypothetical protein